MIRRQDLMTLPRRSAVVLGGFAFLGRYAIIFL